MSITTVFLMLALVFAGVEQIDAKGRSILAWAVILICVALLWGWLGELGGLSV